MRKEVGVGVQVHVVAVDVKHAIGLGLVGVHLDAAGGRSLAEPGQRLEGVVGPSLDERAVAAVVSQLDEVADESLLARLARLVQIDTGGHIALGRGRGLPLHAGDLGTSLGGRHGGGHAGNAGAHHNDFKVAYLVELRDGLGGNEEAGRAISGGSARAGSGHGRALGLRRLSEPVVEVVACVLAILLMGTLLCVLFSLPPAPSVPCDFAAPNGFAGSHYACSSSTAHLPRSTFAVYLCKQVA